MAASAQQVPAPDRRAAVHHGTPNLPVVFMWIGVVSEGSERCDFAVTLFWRLSEIAVDLRAHLVDQLIDDLNTADGVDLEDDLNASIDTADALHVDASRFRPRKTMVRKLGEVRHRLSDRHELFVYWGTALVSAKADPAPRECSRIEGPQAAFFGNIAAPTEHPSPILTRLELQQRPPRADGQ